MEQAIEGAKQGHYAASLLDTAQARGFRDQLTNVIRHTAMVRGTVRGPEQIKAWIWVYGRNDDDQVGYLLVLEKLPGSLATNIELYKVGVRLERRKQGHGRRIVQLFVASASPNLNLYAWCLLPSDTMFSLAQGNLNCVPARSNPAPNRSCAKKPPSSLNSNVISLAICFESSAVITDLSWKHWQCLLCVTSKLWGYALALVVTRNTDHGVVNI